MLISRIQLERFLRLVFAFETSQNNLVLDREAIVNNSVTRPSTSVPALTNNVCATLMRYCTITKANT
jgi:hypothetical protein